MSFADYTSLKSAIATDWLNRADLTTSIGDYIALFESDFNADIRVRQMETETAQVSTAGFLLHPTGWLGWKQVSGTFSSRKYDLQPVTDEIADIRVSGEMTGNPARFYKVKADRTYIYPATNASFNTVFYQGVGLVSGTNWLLTAYPGAYLYGALLAATASTGDDARIPLWQQAYLATLERIKAGSRRQEWSGQVLRMNPDIRVR